MFDVCPQGCFWSLRIWLGCFVGFLLVVGWLEELLLLRDSFCACVLCVVFMCLAGCLCSGFWFVLFENLDYASRICWVAMVWGWCCIMFCVQVLKFA